MFENYKCFEKSQISFKDISIIVGKNNAGKSTIIEALRLVALASRRAQTAIYTDPPKSLELPLAYKGFKLAVDKIKIDIRGAVYYYKDNETARISATFANNAKLTIHIKGDVVFACLFQADGQSIHQRTKVKQYLFDSIYILPQIGLIKENEPLLSRDTVVSDKETYLSSRHFRNELWLNKNDYFEEFKLMCEDTWAGLRVRELLYEASNDKFIQLIISDGGFPAEIGLMGSGIQMWLQIIWFLCRTKSATTVILDEPDVYMHPDLQRSLLRLVKRRYPQIIIATHSVEILSEVDPKSIVTIDKTTRQMKYANNLKAVQSIVENIGSVHNLSLVRIGQARKCVFVEGEDLKILSKFYDLLFPNSEQSLEAIPYVELKGFSNLVEAYGASKLFFEETQGQIASICILDRDYYPDEYLADKMKKAIENNLALHIWSKKEVENYALIPVAVFRISEQPIENYADFLEEYEELAEQLKEYTQDCIMSKIYDLKRSDGWDVTKCTQWARNFMKAHWTSLQNKLDIISGKEMIKKTNEWVRRRYGKSCSLSKIISNMKAEEVDVEIKETLALLAK